MKFRHRIAAVLLRMAIFIMWPPAHMALFITKLAMKVHGGTNENPDRPGESAREGAYLRVSEISKN
jgi:hypothetical protein